MKLVAVYGTLRAGFNNHRLLTMAQKMGDFISPAKFTMYNNGFYPYLTEGGNTAIKCEVYKVSDQTLQSLDALEGVASGHYRRGSLDTPWGEAIIYVASDRTAEGIEDLPVVKSGDWARKE
jgi:gamma-glutamylcyclotransferase (GGCT)/AIG2-like uncharacterized protein YtfP